MTLVGRTASCAGAAHFINPLINHAYWFAHAAILSSTPARLAGFPQRIDSAKSEIFQHGVAEG